MPKKRYTSLRTDAEAYELMRLHKLANLPQAKIREIAVFVLGQMCLTSFDPSFVEMAEKRGANANVERLDDKK